MWSSVANLKECLHKIALNVHDDDDDEDLSIYTSPQWDQFQSSNALSDRRISRNLNGLATPTRSPIANDLGTPSNHKVEQYMAEIKRLRESEAEIKALSVNYAALLKEKENQISRLIKEKDWMKQNIVTENAAHNSSKTIPKDLTDTIEEKNKSLAMVQASHEAQLKQMVAEHDHELDKLASMQKKLQEEQMLHGSFQRQLNLLNDENSKMLMEMHKTRDELSQKITEVGRLQEELQRREQESNDTEKQLKSVIATLEDENSSVKKEKGELEASFRAFHSSCKDEPNQNKHLNGLNEGSRGIEEMQQSLSKLEKDLKETCRERDKALQELNRLKQHLLEKASEESEKMDEDSKIIEELRETNEHQRYQISRLENALKQAIGAQEEIEMSINSELKKAKEAMDELNRKLASCMSTIDAKNIEVLNLQTALGQYYAEIEAKEADQQTEGSKREKEELLGKFLHAERVLAEGKSRVIKLEEDNEKLRRALEQSMTRLNRMSMDSDFLVDRRIMIKLLVTYLQRNHSKEVLDLMVRMLGFSDEDKQRIGLAQQGSGRGVVRGVLGIPGRLVAGILGGSSADASATMASDNQSITDLWMDFLLNEAERERRWQSDAANDSNPDLKPAGNTPTSSTHIGTTVTAFNISSPTSYPNRNQIPLPSRGNFMQREHSDSEFSTVPLTSVSNSRSSWPPPRY